MWQTPMLVWNADGIVLRDDTSGALGELEIRLRPRSLIAPTNAAPEEQIP